MYVGQPGTHRGDRKEMHLFRLFLNCILRKNGPKKADKRWASMGIKYIERQRILLFFSTFVILYQLR